MKRRIMAWVLLACFVLLLLNIAFIRFMWQASIALYLVIMVWFILRPKNGRKPDKSDDSDESDKSDE